MDAASSEQLDSRFPKPTFVPSSVVPSPVRKAGWTYESTKAVLECLKDNHIRFHCYFNDKGFHNHAAHHLLAIYAMGASSEVLKAAYETHVAYLRPALPSPEAAEPKGSTVIDEANWKDHLGDERYYHTYVSFFSKVLSQSTKGLSAVIDDYIFSADANLVPSKNGAKSLMLGRFHAVLLHPLIHTAYGAEFGLPGLAAEGLAQTAVHPVDAEVVFTPKFFDTRTVTSGTPAADIHALTVLSRVAKDEDFVSHRLGLPLPLEKTLESFDIVVGHADKKILKYAEEWNRTVVPDRDVLKRKYEELVWMNTVIYGVGGWAGRAQGEDKRGKFNGDFFSMHSVTSTLMIASLLNTLSLDSAVLLTRTYFIFSLVIYISRGRGLLPIKDFYAGTSPYPSLPGPQPTATKGTLSPSAIPNPWPPIVQTTLVNPNEHLCKVQRALMHFAESYGSAEPGTLASSELEGAEFLDATLFARVAVLTADRHGWMREGEEKADWDFSGFFGVKA